MATPVFVDTGAYYALADVQDPDHAEAVRLLQQIVRLRYALVTSNFVISEVYTLLRQRLGWEAAIHYVCGDAWRTFSEITLGVPSSLRPCGS
jgi:predicted nucleic acid-binding protein